MLIEICLGFLNDGIFGAGHVRGVCEVNRCSLDDQQQKPSEVSEQYFANHSRNLPYLYGGGCHLDGLKYFENVASVLADAKKHEEKGK